MLYRVNYSLAFVLMALCFVAGSPSYSQGPGTIYAVIVAGRAAVEVAGHVFSNSGSGNRIQLDLEWWPVQPPLSSAPPRSDQLVIPTIGLGDPKVKHLASGSDFSASADTVKRTKLANATCQTKKKKGSVGIALPKHMRGQASVVETEFKIEKGTISVSIIGVKSGLVEASKNIASGNKVSLEAKLPDEDLILFVELEKNTKMILFGANIVAK